MSIGNFNYLLKTRYLIAGNDGGAYINL